jgi:signal transduction histidine kinase/streptogramin lyase
VSKYNGKSFENYTTLQGLSDNSIRCIVEDRNGGIWFSTLGGGISKLRSLGLKYYSAIQWLPNWSILDISKDHEGNIWIGSDVGATKYDGTHFISFTEEQGMINTSRGYAGNAVTKTLQDANGDLWFSGASGVNKYDGKHFSFYSSAQGFGNNDNYVITAMQDDKGNIWFGTSTGAFKFDGKSFANYDSLQGLQGNMITDILQDSSDNIWLSSYHNGVSKYDGAKFTHYSKDQGMASNLVFCMAQDTKGGLWFGTDSGVCRYDGKKFIDYNTGSGMASNFIISIVQDTARGIIWLGTDKGLTAMKLDSVTNGPKDAYKFENFDINTGYPINGINAHTLCLDKSGSLWMGCDDNKILKFDYDQINRDTRPLNITIQGIKINNELVCWNNLLQGSQRNKKNDSSALLNEMATTFGNALSASVLDSMRKNFADVRFDSVQSFYPVPVNLSLPFNDNNISIDFVAAEPSLPKQVKYQYTLEGYDKGWSPLSNNTTAVFGNIPEGTYEFRLKALSPFGIWSETRYDFKVLPPWYRTWWAYALFGLLFIGAIWGSIYFRSKQLRRENRILEEKVNLRTHQLKEEKEKVESTLSELKSTQAQLIQSEKMASLGELTAGIAHEIQNPLNFVNNFSEVNQELVDEAELEANNGNFDEVKVIIKNIKANEEKIGHHGKRADAIVKGMLMHSRQNTSLKESTDINALADEYLRLAYHGLRAKGNPFNATIKTDFNESIGNINIIPRDIGRVFLNLYSNALYAVGEKKKQFPEEYEPTLSISTKKDEGKVAISVKDNGSGIPQKVIDKIFQPFFTTKPTGEGTGLGLSLSYDIIKTHGGEIKVNTKEGEFTEFVVLLPIIS